MHSENQTAQEENIFGDQRDKIKPQIKKTGQFQHVVSKEEIQNLEVIAQFNKKFIFARSYNFPGDLYLLDQHAIAERILLETLQKQTKRSKKVKQTLFDPLLVEISPIEEVILSDTLPLLNTMGYSIQLESNSKIKIQAHPIFFGRHQPPHVITYNFRQIIDDLQNAGPDALIKAVSELEIAKSIACRNSIKAGDSLSKEEMENLLSKMKKAAYPWVCCHGRPSIFKIREKNLDKLFWRS